MSLPPLLALVAPPVRSRPKTDKAVNLVSNERPRGSVEQLGGRGTKPRDGEPDDRQVNRAAGTVDLWGWLDAARRWRRWWAPARLRPRLKVPADGAGTLVPAAR